VSLSPQDHVRRAEELLAEDWANADTGWKASLSWAERVAAQQAAATEAVAHLLAVIVVMQLLSVPAPEGGMLL
jgi:hypothetical protein